MRRYLIIIVLSFGLFAQAKEPQSPIRLLYFNDAHEHDMVVTPVGKLGGIARMKSVVDSIRATDPSALLLFGGDLAGGTISGKLFRGSVMIGAFNEMGVDIANFGQHDFDYGVGNTELLVSKSNFKWLSSNAVKRGKESANGVYDYIKGSLPYLSLELNACKVGFIGLVDKVSTTKPTAGVVQLDIFKAAESAIKALGEVDVLVAITQMDMKLNEDLVTRFPMIDVVFTEETSQYMTQVLFLSNTPIIAGSGNMGHLSEVIIGGGKVPVLRNHVISETVEPDEAMQSKVEQINCKMSRELNQVVGLVASNYIGSRSGAAHLVAEAYKHYYGADFGLINGGGIRSLLGRNEVTLRDVYSLLPFENLVVPVYLTGRELYQVFAVALSTNPASALAGADFLYEIDENESVVLKEIYGVDLNKRYLVVMPDYILLGGGDYTAIAKDNWAIDLVDATVDSDILLDYIKK